jgi:glycosyltransferase involved in cell wall biosynthesis
MKVLHLTASPFLGGPERVILDIVRSQIEYGFDVSSVIATFKENGNCEQFLSEIHNAGLVGYVLDRDVPNFFGALRDVINLLRREKIDLVCAHGHKSRFLGWIAARYVGIPIVGISHGWTWQDWKTSVYERIDQWIHHRMDKVVCVSQGQADKVIKTGTNPNRVVVIYNAVDVERFSEMSNWANDTKSFPDKLTNEYNQTNTQAILKSTKPDTESQQTESQQHEAFVQEQNLSPTSAAAYFARLVGYFDAVPELLIGAAGRLSPEKGYDVLIEAVKILVDEEKADNVEKNYCNDKYDDKNHECTKSKLTFGLVLFGEGFTRAKLQKQIDEAGISDRFKMVGFTSELDYFLPCFDVFVQSSRTEGFPCVNLEAMASGLSVIATQVGGVPEQIESGYDGILVPPNDPNAIATAIKSLIVDPTQRKKLGENARQSVKTKFTKNKLAKEYFNLFDQLHCRITKIAKARKAKKDI